LKKDYKSWTLETSFDAYIKDQMEVDSEIVVNLYSLGDREVLLYKSDFVMMRNNGRKGPPWWPNRRHITFRANCENVWAKYSRDRNQPKFSTVAVAGGTRLGEASTCKY
jgi:hypothetical protein